LLVATLSLESKNAAPPSSSITKPKFRAPPIQRRTIAVTSIKTYWFAAEMSPAPASPTAGGAVRNVIDPSLQAFSATRTRIAPGRIKRFTYKRSVAFAICDGVSAGRW
jgi:hypothetical protein